MSCCTLQELTEKVPFIPEIIGDYADDTDLLDGGGTGGPGNTKIGDYGAMAIRVVEFSNGGYKIRKIFA